MATSANNVWVSTMSWHLLLNRLGPGREFTVRITGAPIKNPARFGSFFTDIPAASFGGAFYSHTEGHGVFAFRVSRAGQKPAEPAFLGNHFLSAFFAFYLFSHILNLSGVFTIVGCYIPCILTRGVVGAGHKTAVSSPFDDHRIFTFFTDNIRRLFFPFHLPHVRFCLFQLFREGKVKILQGIESFSLPLFYHVQLGFHGGGKGGIQDPGKVFH